MELLLIILIAVISAVVSASSKSKHKKDEEPARPVGSDVARAFSLFDDMQPEQKPTAQTNDTVQKFSRPIVQDAKTTDELNTLRPLQWGSLKNPVPMNSSEGTSGYTITPGHSLSQSIQEHSESSLTEIKEMAKEIKADEKISKHTGRGLDLTFGSNEILSGFVYSEILGRKRR